MSNCERFNAMLNSCQRPKAVCDVLQAESETPNFFRLAKELSKFKNPYKAADMLLAVAGSVLKEDGQHG